MAPERDGDRGFLLPRSTVLNLDALNHKCTAMARMEAASTGLAAGLLGHGVDPDFAAVSAITLIDAALRDLQGRES
jgi:hypothetical protein